jgi:lipid-binding SYLF domain-containing protein
MTRFLVPLSLAALAAPAAAAPPHPVETLRSATDALDGLRALRLKGLPPALLADAQAVAVIPNVVKAGLVIGGRAGHGVVLPRNPDETWGEPTFVRLGGASLGFQAGVQSSDVVLVFRTKKGLDRLLDGKGKLTLGADAAVAAGPVGRQAEAGTDARLRAEILSYSRSRGLFAGVALEGAALTADDDANRFFRRDTRPEARKALDDLKAKLTELGPDRPDGLPKLGEPRRPR